MVLKIKHIIICTIILFNFDCLSKDFNKSDYIFKDFIIGTWIVDTEQAEPYPFPGYIEYFKNGTSNVHFFEDEKCENEIISDLLHWKIDNGYLYYKDVSEFEWSKDKIIKMTNTHHVLLSKGETLYRKRGIVCNNLDLSDE